MPRVKLFDQEEAIQKALELFWEKGYISTSLSDLTSHLGISKGSFYDTFKSKRALFEKCFEQYRASKMEKLTRFLTTEPDVKVGLKKILEFNLEELLIDEKHKGCFLANTGSELGARDELLREGLLVYYDMIHEALSNYLAKGGISSSINPEFFANLVITFIIGMNQEVKIKRDQKSFLSSISYILSLLD